MSEETGTTKGVIEATKRLARLLEERHGSQATPEALVEDPDFEAAVATLADGRVPVKAVTLLGRHSSRFVACIAAEALARREDVPKGWRDAALARLPRATELETFFLLRALGAMGRKPLIARVVGALAHDPQSDAVVELIRAFALRRLEGGEVVDEPQLRQHVAPGGEDLLDRLIAALPPVHRAELSPAVEAWRAALIEWTFFEWFARRVDPQAGPVTTLVGDRAAALDAITRALTARRSVLLVGEPGVGKSSVIREALRRVHDLGWRAFEATASDVNAGQSYIGQMEGRIQEIARRTTKRKLAWLMPGVEDAIWAGQYRESPRGMLDALAPHLISGDVVLVGEIEPLAFEQLLQLRPRIAAAFEVVRLAAPSAADVAAIARGWADSEGVEVSDDVIRAACELATHFLAATAPPGSVLRLLKAADPPITERALLEALSESSGLPVDVLDPEARLDVGDLRSHFTGRVLGQPEAVESLVERIALIKAGLTDPTRPLGVFLFVGPTGTGKTEIAKALAEWLFGSPERMVRLDMSEYQTPDSLERLLSTGRPGQPTATFLASVRKDPFSVVLLDEFEKAHPRIWDVFLQVFDDGRLTDETGRTADLRQCVIVLTSNVGSSIPAGPGLGFSSERQPFDPGSVERAVGQSFRPEFLNRLDRVVVFRPLERETMRELLRLELAAVLERRGFRIRPWAVEWDEAAIELLLELGFTAELGARPLKRAVERHVLAPLAMAIVERRYPEGDQFLFISGRDGRIEVEFVDPDEEPAPPVEPPSPSGLSVRAVALDPRGTDEEAALLGAELDELRARLSSDAWRERKDSALAVTREPGFWQREDRFARLGRAEYLDRIDAAMRTAENLHHRLRGKPSPRTAHLLAQRIHILNAACYGVEIDAPVDATLTVTGDAGLAAELADMYASWARARGMRLEPTDSGFAVTGLGAHVILAPEHGLHVLELPEAGEGHGFRRITAQVTVGPDATPSRKIVRRYRREPSPLVRDTPRGWRTGRLDRVLTGDFDLMG